jgi:hypothetical protein
MPFRFAVDFADGDDRAASAGCGDDGRHHGADDDGAAAAEADALTPRRCGGGDGAVADGSVRWIDLEPDRDPPPRNEGGGDGGAVVAFAEEDPVRARREVAYFAEFVRAAEAALATHDERLADEDSASARSGAPLGESSSGGGVASSAALERWPHSALAMQFWGAWEGALRLAARDASGRLAAAQATAAAVPQIPHQTRNPPVGSAGFSTGEL